jgi:hypothetical protein
MLLTFLTSRSSFGVFHHCTRSVCTSESKTFQCLLLSLVLSLNGCSGYIPRQDPAKLKEKTAQTTAELKRDAKAIAQGMREGWSRDKHVDLNTATSEQLVGVGLTRAQAARIIAHRPYQDPQELVTERILTEREYKNISDKVMASSRQ